MSCSSPLHYTIDGHLGKPASGWQVIAKRAIETHTGMCSEMVAQIEGDNALMGAIHLQVNRPPAKFPGLGDHLVKQSGTDARAATLGRDIKLFQPPADPAVFKTENRAREGHTQHPPIVRAGHQHETIPW